MILWHFCGILGLSACFLGLLVEMKGPSMMQVAHETIRLNPVPLQDLCLEAGCAVAFRAVASARAQDYVR